MLSPDAEEMERRMSGMALAEPPAPVSSVGETLHVSGTDRYFVPLRLACESKLPRIMEVALHCIQKLILYGYVRGKEVSVGKVKKSMMDVVMETVCTCKDQEDEAVQLQIVKAVLTAVTSTVAAVHDTTLLLAVKTCFYIYLVSKSSTIQSTANATLTQMLNVVFQRLELSNAPPVIQRDAFLVFRSLCKLSMKPLPEPLPSDDSIELRSKLLSLQLLNSIIQSSGATFRSGEKFIWAIRQYLCLSLLKNGVSPIAAILQLSLDIFVTLIRFFKAHLKSEIGVFFSNILLRILESSNSSGQQKLLTVQSLRVLVREPQLIVDLFLNYDCDLEGKGIFTATCDDLSRLTLSSVSLTESSEQEATLKTLALETLVNISDSMVQWEREGRELTRELSNRVSEAADAQPPHSPRDGNHSSAASEVGVNGAEPAATAAPTSSAIVPAAREEGDDVDFEAMFHRKHEVHEGVVKFNMKPKRGIKYLKDVCGLEDNPKAIAKFLLETEGLDKRAVGDYLGEGEDFSKQVLYAYVDMIDFGGLTFDAALRKFLSHFWLPGEAQKIDRMMEKFAERYCSQNNDSGIFANADAAYVLAYSLIMLNTDAHSAQIKKKMTQEEFVKMNRGINDSKDLPTPFLEQSYQAITTNEIKIKDDGMSRESTTMSRPSKSKLFHMESAIMVKESQEAFKLKARKKSVYHSSRNVEHVRPMFEASWCALLAACSSVMEDTRDDLSEPVIALTLRGFANGVHIAAEFGMCTERDAFVTMLAKYTYLESAKTMGRRNIEAFKTLVTIALSDGNVLGSSWAQVLKCLSEFHRLHMIGTGAKTDGHLFFPGASAAACAICAPNANNGDAAPSTPSSAGATSPSGASAQGKLQGAGSSSTRHAIMLQPARSRTHTRDNELAAVEMANSHTMVDQVDVVAIDRIFSNSTYLGADAIVVFVTHLCMVSREELEYPTDPQVYSLQKIVEVAYYNMPRVRLVWARIWEVLGEFFTEVGQHRNLSIAMYAVDSLRQLAAKFLEKGELLNYQFQREFLKPFQDLMAATASLEIKDLILNCLGHMIQSRASSIRSGWSSLYKVFELAAYDRAPTIARTGYDLVCSTIGEDSSQHLRDHHVSCVACVIAYVRQEHHESIALSACDTLLLCVKLLHDVEPAELRDAAATFSPAAPSAAATDADAADLPAHERLWWALVECLSSSVRDDARLAVRTAALKALSDVFAAELREGGALGGPFGVRVFRELGLAMMDGALLRDAENALSPAQIEWVQDTGLAVVSGLERALCAAYAMLADELDDLIALLVRCLHQRQHGGLAHVAAESLLHLVRETGANFSQETWASICHELKSCFEAKGDAEAAVHEAGGASMAVSPEGGECGLIREVSLKVEAEAPEGSGPHELQVLMLSTVFQLLQSMHSSMKLADVDGLLNSMHAMYEKANRVLQDALSDEVAEEEQPSESALAEASHLKLESMSFYLQILFPLYARLESAASVPAKNAEPPALGSEEHTLLIAAAVEYRLVSFSLHVLRDFLKLREVAQANPADGARAQLASRALRELEPTVVTLLQGLLSFHEWQFAKHLPAFYPLFVDLMHCDSKEIRGVLREVFSQRVGLILQQQQA